MTLAAVLLGVVASIHLIVVTVTLAHLTLRGAHVGHGSTLALVVHLPLLVLTTVLAATLRSGHPWALRPSTISQAFAIVFANTSTPEYASLVLTVPAAIVTSALIITLLWALPTSRRFFRRHPRSRTSLPS